MEALTNIVNQINGVVWGPLMLILILGTGLFLQVGLKLVPIRKIPGGSCSSSPRSISPAARRLTRRPDILSGWGEFSATCLDPAVAGRSSSGRRRDPPSLVN